jgi:hypothetical protein
MLAVLVLTAIVASHAPADTTVTFGTVTRDLTGDGVPEVLTLTGIGKAIDDLNVTFTIQSSGRTIYSKTRRLTRATFQLGRRPLPDVELRTRLSEFGSAFFADEKFMTPEGFVSWLRRSARLHIPLIPEVISHEMAPPDSARARGIWEQMRASGITVFEFSLGGDGITVIGWSATDQRFYGLLECC